jgi:hypothetical protein
MIGSLLTKSGEEIKKGKDSQKIETLCIKRGEEITFVKNYITQVMNDQNILIRNKKGYQCGKINTVISNVLEYDNSKSIDIQTDGVPRCFNEVTRLIIKHNIGIRKKTKTLKDQLKTLDRSQKERWDNFPAALSKHLGVKLIMLKTRL